MSKNSFKPGVLVRYRNPQRPDDFVTAYTLDPNHPSPYGDRISVPGGTILLYVEKLEFAECYITPHWDLAVIYKDMKYICLDAWLFPLSTPLKD